MPEANDNAFMRFLNEKLVPFSTRVGQNWYRPSARGPWG